jgi:hypothetical protein
LQQAPHASHPAHQQFYAPVPSLPRQQQPLDRQQSRPSSGISNLMSKVHLGRSPEQVARTSQDGKKKRNSLLESLKSDTGGSKDKGRQAKRLSASHADSWRQAPPPLVTAPRAAQTERIPTKLQRGSVPQDASADGTKRRSFPKLSVRDFTPI